ncbi:MAG: DUF2062 domain-containing protein [Gammaproteobacteria bacterium]
MDFRDVFHRFLPSRQALYGNRFVNFLGHRLRHPGLWHINRRSTARAVSIGLFIAFIPLPVHIPLAAICAVALRINLPILVLAALAMNPLTVVPFGVLAYHTGAWLMQAPPSADFTPSFEWLTNTVSSGWVMLSVGSLALGVVFAILGFFTVQGVWRWHLLRRWRRRRQRRLGLAA